MAARLLHVDMLAGGEGQDRRRRMPVVGRGDDDRVERRVFQGLAEILQPLRSAALKSGDARHRFRDGAAVHVADIGHLRVLQVREGSRPAPGRGCSPRRPRPGAVRWRPDAKRKSSPPRTPKPMPPQLPAFKNSRRLHDLIIFLAPDSGGVRESSGRGRHRRHCDPAARYGPFFFGRTPRSWRTCSRPDRP